MHESPESQSPPVPDLSVVIPAFNEEDRLPVYLDAVHEYLRRDGRSFEVIVVDDGSSDETARRVRDRAAELTGLRLIRHAANAGKGAAVRTGMRHGRGRMRLFTDADGATPISELADLERAIESGHDVAVGSREVRGKRVRSSPLRRFMGRWFNRVVRAGAVKGVRDTQCGFKLFAPAALELFELQREDGFVFDVELLYLAQRKGLKVAEVPVNWNDQPGSKVRLLRDGYRMIRGVARIRRRWRNGDYDAPRATPTPLA